MSFGNSFSAINDSVIYIHTYIDAQIGGAGGVLLLLRQRAAPPINGFSVFRVDIDDDAGNIVFPAEALSPPQVRLGWPPK